jgi:hypothetical protein
MVKPKQTLIGTPLGVAIQIFDNRTFGLFSIGLSDFQGLSRCPTKVRITSLWHAGLGSAAKKTNSWAERQDPSLQIGLMTYDTMGTYSRRLFVLLKFALSCPPFSLSFPPCLPLYSCRLSNSTGSHYPSHHETISTWGRRTVWYLSAYMPSFSVPSDMCRLLWKDGWTVYFY